MHDKDACSATDKPLQHAATRRRTELGWHNIPDQNEAWYSMLSPSMTSSMLSSSLSSPTPPLALSGAGDTFASCRMPYGRGVPKL